MHTQLTCLSVAVLVAVSAGAASASGLVDGSTFAEALKDRSAYSAWDGKKDHAFDLSNVVFSKENSATTYGALVWGDSVASYESTGSANVYVENAAGSATGLGANVINSSDKTTFTHGGTINVNVNGDVNVTAVSRGNGGDGIAIQTMRSNNDVSANPSFTTINADVVRLSAESDSGYAVGIWAQNNDVDATNPSKVTINARHTYITAKSGKVDPDKAGEYADIGIVAYSGAQVEIKGGLTIDARTAISTRGNAKIVVNKEGTGSVQMNGDVIFYYDAPT